MSLLNIFKRQKQVAGAPEWIIAGLGNPGPKYEHSRHNAGFMALDALCEKNSVKLRKIRFFSLIGYGTISDSNILFVKPQTFMNLSGKAVSAAADYYRIPMERVIVIYDDVSLPVGKIRVRKKGSAGGHNGIKDIIRLCGTEDFPRVKIGIGSPENPGYELTDWVLGRFGKEEIPAVKSAIERAALAAEKIIAEGAEAAAGEFN